MHHLWRTSWTTEDAAIVQWRCSRCGCLALRRDSRDPPEAPTVYEIREPSAMGWWEGEIPDCSLFVVAEVLRD